MPRVRIGTCHDPADASVVRSMLAAHDIESVVSGEQHANLLGGLGGALISLDIWVAAEDAEQASELLRELREGTHDDLPDDSADDGDDAGEAVLGASRSSIETTIEKRRHLGVVLLLAFCVTFGTAHMYMRAWAIGFVLAATQLAALAQLRDHQTLGIGVLVACIVVDAVGAILRVRAIGRVTLPAARAR